MNDSDDWTEEERRAAGLVRSNGYLWLSFVFAHLLLIAVWLFLGFALIVSSGRGGAPCCLMLRRNVRMPRYLLFF